MVSLLWAELTLVRSVKIGMKTLVAPRPTSPTLSAFLCGCRVQSQARLIAPCIPLRVSFCHSYPTLDLDSMDEKNGATGPATAAAAAVPKPSDETVEIRDHVCRWSLSWLEFCNSDSNEQMIWNLTSSTDKLAILVGVVAAVGAGTVRLTA